MINDRSSSVAVHSVLIPYYIIESSRNTSVPITCRVTRSPSVQEVSVDE